jgi:ATP-dependent Clp protease protease subunit
MEMVKEETEIHTIGVGKVMSAGTLLLAAGTKGKRKIARNCRVMIHNVAAGNFGILPNLTNELEAIQQLQEDYITAMVENTKFTRKKLEKLLNEKVNIYLSAEEAVKYGLACRVVC